MKNKLARIKYLPNNFEILEDGDHVICAISGKKIFLDKLNYWNVDLQEPYFSHIEASQKREDLEKKNWFTSNDHETKSTDQDFLKSFFLIFY